MIYIRTVGYRNSHGAGVRTHLDGFADSYTLCGVDTAGDNSVHAKDPVRLDGKHRVTCEHCKAIIAIVKEHLGLQ